MSKIDFSRLITAEEKSNRAAAKRDKAERDAALSFLQDTDWYVLRLAETGEAIPAKIAKERQGARDRIGGKRAKAARP